LNEPTLDTQSHHWLIEAWDVDYTTLNDKSLIETLFIESVKTSGATYINHYFHEFSPHGVSGVVIIAESHLSIHTWPEKGYAAMDVFTCGCITIGQNIVNSIHAAMQDSTFRVTYIERGQPIQQKKRE
jgi:S-adenosylmethionine decarboxylase